MKNFHSLSLLISALLAIASNVALASNHDGKPAVAVTAPSAATADMAEAEIRKIDMDTQRITLKHGPIKNLDMPPMTMVFSAKDKAMLNGLAAGDKVQFAAEMVGGKFTVTDIKKMAP